MTTIKLIFWMLVAIIFYTYIGYGLLLYSLVFIKNRIVKKSKREYEGNYEPEVTLFITAYNEGEYIHSKMKNSNNLDYPANKLQIVWVTDGTNDDSLDQLSSYSNVNILHKNERLGKIHAMNRGMKFITTPIVVFSDANTLIGKESIRRIVNLFNDPKVGCVSGEKRIFKKSKDSASGSGEGMYWKYESKLKKWDAELYSSVGAAGELFALRTSCFEEVENDTILDDFIISLRIAKKGYTIQYDPEAFAIESASLNVKEELKRKIRIAAGGIQAIIRLRSLLNIFNYGVLSFQYISHRVLRWTLTPICLLLSFPLMFFIKFSSNNDPFNIYDLLFWLQVMFILLILLGYLIRHSRIQSKVIFVPYYFYIMNLAVLKGMIRYFRKSQSVIWEQAKRQNAIVVLIIIIVNSLFQI